jgi:hypothetical protein
MGDVGRDRANRGVADLSEGKQVQSVKTDQVEEGKWVKH